MVGLGPMVSQRIRGTQYGELTATCVLQSLVEDIYTTQSGELTAIDMPQSFLDQSSDPERGISEYRLKRDTKGAYIVFWDISRRLYAYAKQFGSTFRRNGVIV